LDEISKKHWDSLESRLSMELGLEELTPHSYGFYNASKIWISGTWSTDKVCKDWFLAEFAPEKTNPDRHMKERIGFLELAFRDRDQWLTYDAQTFELMAKQGYYSLENAQSTRRNHQVFRDAFSAWCNELNERFRRAHVPLHYHNGFIQFTSDEKVEMQIVQPFWRLVDGKKWENVSIDMAEAVDRRDAAGRDPAFYAAKALESAIKIISDEKGWTRGVEKGASNYIDNLVTERNAVRFIDVWEKDVLNAYFGKVRNQFGHGPGGEPMPTLSKEQTDWAIENAMSWCKSLIERL
jgi:hypothetical protein